MNKRSVKILIGFLLLLPLAFACSKKSPTAPPPDDGRGGIQPKTLTVTATPPQIPPDNSTTSTVTAVALDSTGKGVENITVRFRSKIGTGVTITPDSALTDAGGRASVTVRSSTAGVDTITASTTTLSARTQLTYTSYVLIIDSIARSIPPGGISGVRVKLTYLGQPVQGDTITFRVTKSGSSIQSFPPHNITDTLGNARALYFASSSPGWDTVYAEDTRRSLKTYANISIGGGTREDSIPAFVIVETINPYWVQIRGVGGNEKSQISVRVYNLNGNPIPFSVTVTFKIISGPNGGETFNPSSTTTDTGGVARTVFNSGTRPGVVKFMATATHRQYSVSSFPAVVTIVGDFPARNGLTVRPEKCLIGGRTGTLGEEFKINVVLHDTYGNPPLKNTAVWFSTDPYKQHMVYPGWANTDETGKCSNTFRTAKPNDSTWATVTVWTKDRDGGDIIDTAYIMNHGMPGVMSITPNPFSFVCDGGENFTLRIEDNRGNPIGGRINISITPDGSVVPDTFGVGGMDCERGNGRTIFQFSARGPGRDPMTGRCLYSGPARVMAVLTSPYGVFTTYANGQITGP